VIPLRSLWAGACALLALWAGGPAIAADTPASETLDALVARALEKVPSLASVQATARAQRARENAAESPYWPQVALAASYARLNGVFPAAFNGAPLDNSSGNVTLRQLITNFGQTDAQVAVATAAAEASEAQVRASAVQVSFTVRQAYLQWAQARGLEAQAQAQVKNAEQLRTRAQSFFTHGARPRIDVTRAEVVVAQARAGLVDARNQVEIARRTLETAIGGEAVSGEPAFPAEPPLVRAPLSEIEALARRVHPTLAVSQAQLRGAEASVQLTQRLSMPDLSFNATGGARTQAFAAAPAWQAGLNLGMPLFTGFNIQQQQEAAAEVQKAVKADLRDRELQVLLGVDRAHIAISGARERLAALKVALSSAQENFKLAQNRYRDGVGSIIEVSDAQTLLAGAEAELVRGTGNLHLAIADLERAVGLTGLEPAPLSRPISLLQKEN
jgi:outer membrane protein TolC